MVLFNYNTPGRRLISDIDVALPTVPRNYLSSIACDASGARVVVVGYFMSGIFTSQVRRQLLGSAILLFVIQLYINHSILMHE
jgi:hypothetical protein